MDTARCSIRVRAHATSGWLSNQTTFSNSIISILAETVRSSGFCLFLLNSCSPACSCVLLSPASILHVYMSVTTLDEQLNNLHFTRVYVYICQPLPLTNSLIISISRVHIYIICCTWSGALRSGLITCQTLGCGSPHRSVPHAVLPHWFSVSPCLCRPLRY